MSKGTKEAKKPKRAAPSKTPGNATPTAVPVKVSRPVPHKKWPTS